MSKKAQPSVFEPQRSSKKVEPSALEPQRSSKKAETLPSELELSFFEQQMLGCAVAQPNLLLLV